MGTQRGSFYYTCLGREGSSRGGPNVAYAPWKIRSLRGSFFITIVMRNAMGTLVRAVSRLFATPALIFERCTSRARGPGVEMSLRPPEVMEFA